MIENVRNFYKICDRKIFRDVNKKKENMIEVLHHT